MIGNKYEKLIVVEYIGKRYYNCKCECGSFKIIRSDKLTYGLAKDCGCESKQKILDRWIGKRFDKLIVLELLENRRCVCKCDCGNETIVFTNNLGRGNTTSCGCVFKEVQSIKTKLNTFYPFEYRSWMMMKNRCLNVNSEKRRYYKDIQICEQWLNSFEIFMKDMGERPSPKKDYSIDRINNEMGYYPENCRWATRYEQSNNRRKRNTVILL